MNTPTFSSFPLEITIRIVTSAAETSPSIARTLLQVSRWTRAIAMNALHSVLVLQIVDLDTATLYYFDRNKSDTKRTMKTPFSLQISLSQDSELQQSLKQHSQAELHISYVDGPLKPHLPHSLWIDGEMNIAWSPRTNGRNHVLGAFFKFLSQKGSLCRLAIEPLSIIYLVQDNLRILDKGSRETSVFHVAFVDQTKFKYAPLWPLPRKMSALRHLLSQTVSLPAVTHFEAGIVISPIKSLDGQRYAQLIFRAFPNVTHLAFTFYTPPSTMPVSAPQVEELLQIYLDHPTLQLLVLVVRDKLEVAKLHERGFNDVEDIDEPDSEEVPRTLVEKFSTPRLTYVVPPTNIPEWALWEQCCREGRDIWDMALEQRETRGR